MANPALAAWRALVDKELAGASFDRLVQVTAEGIALQPLYTEHAVEPGVPGAPPYLRGATAAAPAGRLCMRIEPGQADALADDLANGADAVWIDLADAVTRTTALAATCEVLVEAAAPDARALAALPEGIRVVAHDPILRAARGLIGADRIADELAAIADLTPAGVRVARVSSVAVHEAGADAADELAYLLSAGVAVLRAFDERGIGVAAANAAMTMQVAVARDTFGELCKLRALRGCWHRVLAAAGARTAPPPPIHAVTSARTLAQRDPWVNLLRATTQVFAAILGGAHWITPSPFDGALADRSPLGRRTARNTVLVLRDESHLGRVIDAAGGAHYIEARTDALAREAWSRFQALEREGGVIAALAAGRLRAQLDAAWQQRAAGFARRRDPVLGVSEFANLDEHLPSAIPAVVAHPTALPRHRDGEAFEALRARLEQAPARDVALLALGPLVEHKARTGYATALFATAGVRTRELTAPTAADVVCVCGSDERYAVEAVDAVRALKHAGATRVVLAGRPGALEVALRAAGCEAFVFVGGDALATLTELLA